MEALQQRVVQLPRDACAFPDARVERLGERVLNMAHPIPVSRPQKRQERHRGDCAEPGGLAVRRSDGELQRGGALIPDAVAVGRHHPERVLPRRHIGIERLPPWTGLMPIVVVAIEPVAKLDLLWDREGRRCVIELQVAHVRAHLEAVTSREFLSVDDHGFDGGCRRPCWLRHPGRVQHLHDDSAGKPHAPIGGGCRRVEGTDVWLGAVERIVDAGPNHGIRVRPPLLELSVREAHDAALGIQPPVVLRILNERDDEVAGQAVFRGHAPDGARTPAEQTILGADENGAICASDDVPIQRRTSRIERNLRLDRAVSHQHHVSC